MPQFFSRGTAQYHMQKYSDALDDDEVCISLDPLNRRAFLGKARVLLHNGQADEAEDIVLNILDNDISDLESRNC